MNSKYININKNKFSLSVSFFLAAVFVVVAIVSAASAGVLANAQEDVLRKSDCISTAGDNASDSSAQADASSAELVDSADVADGKEAEAGVALVSDDMGELEETPNTGGGNEQQNDACKTADETANSITTAKTQAQGISPLAEEIIPVPDTPQDFPYPNNTVIPLNHTTLSGYYDSTHPDYGTTLSVKYDCEFYLSNIAPLIKNFYSMLFDEGGQSLTDFDEGAQKMEDVLTRDNELIIDHDINFGLTWLAVEEMVKMTYNAYNVGNPCGVNFADISADGDRDIMPESINAHSGIQTMDEPVQDGQNNTTNSDDVFGELMMKVFGKDLIISLINYDSFIEPDANDPDSKAFFNITNMQNIIPRLQNLAQRAINDLPKLVSNNSHTIQDNEELESQYLSTVSTLIYDIFFIGIIEDLQNGGAPSMRITGDTDVNAGNTTTLNFNSSFGLNNAAGNASFDIEGYTYPGVCMYDNWIDKTTTPYRVEGSSVSSSNPYNDVASDFSNITTRKDCISKYWVKTDGTQNDRGDGNLEYEFTAPEQTGGFVEGCIYDDTSGFEVKVTCPTSAGYGYHDVAIWRDPFCHFDRNEYLSAQQNGLSALREVNLLGCPETKPETRMGSFDASLDSSSPKLSPLDIDTSNYKNGYAGTSDIAKRAIANKLTLVSNITIEDRVRTFACYIGGVFQGAYDTPETCQAVGGTYETVAPADGGGGASSDGGQGNGPGVNGNVRPGLAGTGLYNFVILLMILSSIAAGSLLVRARKQFCYIRALHNTNNS